MHRALKLGLAAASVFVLGALSGQAIAASGNTGLTTVDRYYFFSPTQVLIDPGVAISVTGCHVTWVQISKTHQPDLYEFFVAGAMTAHSTGAQVNLFLESPPVSGDSCYVDRMIVD